jgi:hypothetical protein
MFENTSFFASYFLAMLAEIWVFYFPSTPKWLVILLADFLIFAPDPIS